MRQSMTYGELPDHDLYIDAFLSECPNGIYSIRNARELDAVYPGGNVDLDIDEMWKLIEECCAGWQDNHEMGDLCSCILQTLGFEWI